MKQKKKTAQTLVVEVADHNEVMTNETLIIPSLAEISDRVKLDNVRKTLEKQRAVIDELRDRIKTNKDLLTLACYHLGLAHENEEDDKLKYAYFQIQVALKMINKTDVNVDHWIVSDNTLDHD